MFGVIFAITWSALKNTFNSARIEHDLFRRVAAAGQHFELAPADVERLSCDKAAIDARQRPDEPEVAEPQPQHHVGVRPVEAMRQEEAAIGFGIELGRVEPQHQRIEVFGFAGEQPHAVALGEPAAEPDMVGMVMRGDDAGETPALERAVEHGVPQFARELGVEPGVDEHVAVAVLDQIDVDVVEPERQGQAQPENSRRDFDELQAVLAGRRTEKRGETDALRVNDSSKDRPPLAHSAQKVDDAGKIVARVAGGVEERIELRGGRAHRRRRARAGAASWLSFRSFSISAAAKPGL